MCLPIFVVDTKIICHYDFVKSILSQSANAEPKGRYSTAQHFFVVSPNVLKDTLGVGVENGIISVFFIFTFKMMVIKIKKMIHFLYFLLMTAKNQSQFGHSI